MRRNSGVLVCLLAALALSCRRDDVSGDAADVAGPDEDEDDGDDDGDGDPDMKVLCDLSQFPQLTPEWIALTESSIEGKPPLVFELEVTDDAIFAAGWQDSSTGEPPGFVERRSLDGALEWAVEFPKVRNMSIAWDGQHLYVADGKEVRRWTGDGVADGWVIGAEFIADMAVDAGSVVVVGSYSNQGGHDDYLDGLFGAYTKSMPPAISSGGTFGELNRDDFGQVVAPSPWGGWLAAGSYDDGSAYGHSFVVGFAGADLNVTLEFPGYTAVAGMVAHDDRLIVLGRNTVRGVAWLSSISSQGEELWRHEHQPCPGVDSSLRAPVAGEDFIWAIGSAWTSQKFASPLLVRFACDGQIESVWAFAIEADDYSIWALEVTEDAVYIGGDSRVGDDFRRMIGRVEP